MPHVSPPVPLAEPPATARPDSGGDQPGITPGPATPAAWSVVATADRAYELRENAIYPTGGSVRCTFVVAIQPGRCGTEATAVAPVPLRVMIRR